MDEKKINEYRPSTNQKPKPLTKQEILELVLRRCTEAAERCEAVAQRVEAAAGRIPGLSPLEVTVKLDDSIFRKFKDFVEYLKNLDNGDQNEYNPIYSAQRLNELKGIPRNIVVTVPYISDGDISTHINGEYFSKKLSDEDWFSLKDLDYTEKKEAGKHLIRKYFATEMLRISDKYSRRSEIDYNQFQPSDNFEIRDAVVIEEYNDYLIVFNANGKDYCFELDYSDVLAYFAYDKNGMRTYRVTPEQLAIKYLRTSIISGMAGEDDAPP